MNESTHRIDVTVDTSYIEERSAPDSERYVFAYTITIKNIGNVAAQLISRHWVITDAKGHVQEVRGEGVVGGWACLARGEGVVGACGSCADDGLSWESPDM